MTKENNYKFYQDSNKRELVFHKKYRGYEYFICDLGTHPTAYVKVPKNNKAFGKDYFDLDIDVHGGLTYSSDTLMLIKSNSWFIGWDYAHAGDYMGYYEEFKEYNIHTLNSDYDNKKYTLDEIIEDCKSVINQLITKGSDMTK